MLEIDHKKNLMNVSKTVTEVGSQTLGVMLISYARAVGSIGKNIATNGGANEGRTTGQGPINCNSLFAVNIMLALPESGTSETASEPEINSEIAMVALGEDAGPIEDFTKRAVGMALLPLRIVDRSLNLNP